MESLLYTHELRPNWMDQTAVSVLLTKITVFRWRMQIKCQSAAVIGTKATYMGCESICRPRTLPSTSSVAIYYYCSIRNLLDTHFTVPRRVSFCRGVGRGRGDRGVKTPPQLRSSAVFHIKHALQNTQNDCYQWLSNSSRVHQIRFRLGLRPGPR